MKVDDYKNLRINVQPEEEKKSRTICEGREKQVRGFELFSQELKDFRNNTHKEKIITTQSS